MEEEMEQLLSMGFPSEIAAQALKATGGKSTLKATEWILSHQSLNKPSDKPLEIGTSSPSPPSSQPQNQPRLDRFFPFHSKLTKNPPFSQCPENPISQSSPRSPFSQDPEKPISQRHPNSPFSQDPENPTSQKRPISLFPQLPENPISEKRPKLANSLSSKPSQPLAERMRPCNIGEIIGQNHILGPDSLLSSAIKCNRLPSIVLWGPPGTGKTSIAKAIAASSASASYKFISLSAVTSGVKEVREAVEAARKAKAKCGKRTVLFLDEVHRFNKSQQDSFLPVIEDGSIVFIGATTENPSFHLVTPLLSRCRVLKLNPLQQCDVAILLKRAVSDLERGLCKTVGIRVDVEDDAIEFLASQCDGDARVALNALEVCATTAASRVQGKVQATGIEENLTENGGNNEGSSSDNGGAKVMVNLEDAKEALQCKHLAYDRAGEEHYNLISALHKSMRGSDANAAIYWLARMLEGGEQPLYIARRLIRFASEDVGLADPNALLQAVACYQACHFIGMPECNVNLAQCVAYLALAPKSVAVYQAIKDAQRLVKESVGGNEGVPLHIRNAPTKLMKELGYGKGYIYTPDDPSAPQSFLPPSLLGCKFLEWPPNEA